MMGEDAQVPMVDGNVDPIPDGGPPPPANILARPSRSTTIDISRDNTLVAMVNPSDGTLSTFQTSDHTRVSHAATGAEPSAVVIHPDGTTAFVANQADATVVRVRNIGTSSAAVDATVSVGSEPTGLALSPTGTRLFVAEWGESRVSVIDTQSMSVSTSFPVRSPYALAVTNDLDTEDDDELLVVPEFFGRPNDRGEAHNEGRTGFVQVRPLNALSTEAGVSIPPIPSGFPDAATSDMAFANQLFGVTVVGDRAYVTSISASPQRPVAFNRNVHPIVYVIDLTTRAEDRGARGSMNLADLVRSQIPEAPRHFLADIVAVDFIGTDIAYVLSRGADVVQRLDYSRSPVALGVTGVPQIDLNVQPGGTGSRCQMPTGIVTTIGAGIDGTTRRAYVNCRVTRGLGVIELGSQALASVRESAAPPSGGEVEANNGMRFFFTGRGRWSAGSWSSCASCHPGGLSDNVTWQFGFGPRQSTSLDGSFSHGPGAQEQRVFNWTANFDEVHDFERNTRDVSGGLGAVTEANPDVEGAACGNVAEERVLGLSAPVDQPVKEVQDVGCTRDWDAVEAFMRTIRPPRRRSALDEASVGRGRTLFASACASCHGGGGWTVSRRFWSPSTTVNAQLADSTSGALASLPGRFAAFNAYTTHIQAQPAGLDPVAGVTEALAPPHVGCAIRNVQTFGVRGQNGAIDATATAALEDRVVSGETVRSLGAAGYNVPSLYGMQLGAPFLHHGQAASLEELLDPDGPWREHVLAGDPTFLVGVDEATRAQQLTDLINFILSIDAQTAEVPLPDPALDICSSP